MENIIQGKVIAKNKPLTGSEITLVIDEEVKKHQMEHFFDYKNRVSKSVPYGADFSDVSEDVKITETRVVVPGKVAEEIQIGEVVRVVECGYTYTKPNWNKSAKKWSIFPEREMLFDRLEKVPSKK
jgi:hypothetical protein